MRVKWQREVLIFPPKLLKSCYMLVELKLLNLYLLPFFHNYRMEQETIKSEFKITRADKKRDSKFIFLKCSIIKSYGTHKSFLELLKTFITLIFSLLGKC